MQYKLRGIHTFWRLCYILLGFSIDRFYQYPWEWLHQQWRYQMQFWELWIHQLHKCNKTDDNETDPNKTLCLFTAYTAYQWVNISDIDSPLSGKMPLFKLFHGISLDLFGFRTWYIQYLLFELIYHVLWSNAIFKWPWSCFQHFKDYASRQDCSLLTHSFQRYWYSIFCTGFTSFVPDETFILANIWLSKALRYAKIEKTSVKGNRHKNEVKNIRCWRIFWYCDNRFLLQRKSYSIIHIKSPMCIKMLVQSIEFEGPY